MEIMGRVQNGVIVLQGEAALPEGALVAVTYPLDAAAAVPSGERRVDFPLVRSQRPGTVQLTAGQVHALLEEEDFSAQKLAGDVSS